MQMMTQNSLFFCFMLFYYFSLLLYSFFLSSRKLNREPLKIEIKLLDILPVHIYIYIDNENENQSTKPGNTGLI